jgi:LysM repeat protein
LAQYRDYAIIFNGDNCMKQWKRLIYYLLLNVLVSACTTMAVLFVWDRTHSPLPGGLFSPMAQQQPTATITPPVGGPLSAGPQATPTPVFIAYQVVDGDTFDSIASQYGINATELIAVNGFTKDQPLGAGEVLRIPVHASPGPQADIEIVNVIGAGDLNNERVVLQQSGAGTLLLAGWQLQDGNGNQFTFPALELTQDGFQVNVYTKSGTNTADSLYWSLGQPIWNSGGTVTLLDPGGAVKATFSVP